MPDTPVVFDDVEVLDDDGLGFTCRIGSARAFIGKYVPLDGTTVSRKGDRGRLTLPRWFVEQQNLPLARPLSDREVDQWFALTKLRVATAREQLSRAPGDREAQAALERAEFELAHAGALRAARNGTSR